MSRLCRLRTKSHGPDGQWAYDEITSLRAQLKGAQTAAEFNFQQYQDAGRLLYEVQAQLAASQAREQQLREACNRLTKIRNIEESAIGPLRDAVTASNKALALTSDTTALEAMIKRAGEVMKERAIYFGLAGNTIRALPGVTLEDLK